MHYRIQVLPWCNRQLKRLKKKYPRIKTDLEEVGEILKINPEAGVKISGLNLPLYKIRMKSSDQKKGKSGGYRVIYYFKSKDGIIYLVDIYPKAARTNFDHKKIIDALYEAGLS